VTEWRWLFAGVCAAGGAVLVAILVHPFVGSGATCEGIGFGCTMERATDTLFVAATYALGAAVTVAFVWRRARRGLRLRTAVAAGVALTVLATAAAAWSQLPRYPSAPGPLSTARERWERVLADGRAVAAAGSPLGDALRGLERNGPLTCRDAYGRSTGARELRWAYAGPSGSSHAVTAAAVAHWADGLRRRGEAVRVADVGGDPPSDLRLQVGGFGVADGGVLTVRASFYAGELEITAQTGCHGD
jgi:hypothetical protein